MMIVKNLIYDFSCFNFVERKVSETELKMEKENIYVRYLSTLLIYK